MCDCVSLVDARISAAILADAESRKLPNDAHYETVGMEAYVHYRQSRIATYKVIDRYPETPSAHPCG